jgi:hypothetical protein
MVVSRVKTPLVMPVLDASDDVVLVGRTKYKLDFVTSILIRVGEQQVEPADIFLRTLSFDQDEIAKPKDRGVLDNAIP